METKPLSVSMSNTHIIRECVGLISLVEVSKGALKRFVALLVHIWFYCWPKNTRRFKTNFCFNETMFHPYDRHHDAVR